MRTDILKMASGGNYRIPPVFSESKPYNRWVDEIKVWQSVTDLEEKKQAPAIALSFPEESSVRDKVFSELGVDNLNVDNGVDVLIRFLDKIYKKDELSSAYETYTKFDRFKKSPQMSMEDYLINFDKLYNQTKKYTMTLPEAVLSFKLLEGANLPHKDRQLVLTGVDYSDATHLYKQMTQSLKKFFGKQSLPESESDNNLSDSAIKVEPVYQSNDMEEAYYMPRQNQSRGYQNSRGGFNRGRYFRGNRGNRASHNNRTNRATNPLGPDGKPLKCVICESIFHFAKKCPDSYENREKLEEACLFTGNKLNEIQVLLSESINAAVLDSACSSTVAGDKWMQCYVDSLSTQKRDRIIREQSDTIFRFGGGQKLKSKEKVTFPCEIAGVQCKITTDVVDSDIPLLLGKPSMKKAKVVMDLEHDKATIFGKEVDLQCTSSGHYCLPLEDTEIDVPSDNISVLYAMDDKSPEQQRHIIIKLHKQFAHPTANRLIALLKDAGVHNSTCEKLVNDITEKCEICKLNKKASPRPIACLPLATEFNQVVAMDLKVWKSGTYLLHLIDLATRFSLAAVIKDKRPATIINKIMTLWIGNGMGAPKKFLADNGGEFANDEFRDMAENLNVEVLNSAGYSPWQNGICERNHAVVDDCVKKILDDQPNISLETALVWAVNAKNALQMVNGFSPFQLVFGCNPNLPSIMIDKPPALAGTTTSEIYAKHLNALHSGRRAFIQAETSERIRRALRHQIRPSGTTYQTGDYVYYQKDNK